VSQIKTGKTCHLVRRRRGTRREREVVRAGGDGWKINRENPLTNKSKLFLKRIDL